MTVEDPFVEPAKTCAKTRHVLKVATEGRDMDNLSGPSRKQTNGLGRCVEPTKPFMLKITNGARIVDHVGSVVSEHANYTSDLQDHHPGSTGECLMEGGMLRVSDVCVSRFTIPTVSQLSQGDLGQCGVLEASDTERHAYRSFDEPPAPASELVRYFFPRQLCYC